MNVVEVVKKFISLEELLQIFKQHSHILRIFKLLINLEHHLPFISTKIL